jgi:hypothetical protein
VHRDVGVLIVVRSGKEQPGLQFLQFRREDLCVASQLLEDRLVGLGLGQFQEFLVVADAPFEVVLQPDGILQGTELS